MSHNPYEGYPSITAMSVQERIDGLKQSTLEQLRSRSSSPTSVLALVGLAERDEQYELARAILLALEEFKVNPQLNLF